MTVQHVNDGETKPRSVRVIDFLFDSYLRLLAIVFFLGAIYTWLTVVGFWQGADFRFDTMSVQMKIYSAVLAVILPVASVGLWTTLPWGRVIWFFVIAFQCASILRFGELLNVPDIAVLFHVVTLVIYLCLQLLLHFINKKG